MFSVNTSVVSNSVIRNLQVVETIVLLAASVLFQFLVHLIPSSGTPLGAVLLAMFFAPLVAVIFFKAHTALIVGILSPVLNYFITGSPKAEILPLMTIELVLFVSCLYLFFSISMLKKIGAVFAIIISITLSTFIVSLFGNYNGNVLDSLTTAVPGILLLSLLNYLLLLNREKS
jgi:hypothetical protein